MVWEVVDRWFISKAVMGDEIGTHGGVTRQEKGKGEEEKRIDLYLLFDRAVPFPSKRWA